MPFTSKACFSLCERTVPDPTLEGCVAWPLGCVERPTLTREIAKKKQADKKATHG